MIRLAAAATALLAIGVPDGAAPPPPQDAIAPVVIFQQVVVRVPRPQPPAGGGAQARWRETSGPRCVSARAIAGAMPGVESVDFLLKDTRRVRALLADRCRGLNYYRGLYLTADRNGQVCAGRDMVRSRIGGQCEILEFRALRAERR